MPKLCVGKGRQVINYKLFTELEHIVVVIVGTKITKFRKKLVSRTSLFTREGLVNFTSWVCVADSAMGKQYKV